MAIELKMPALSPTMEKGTLAKWLVSEGAEIKPGDLLAEIETDKATMEFEAIDAGRVASLLVAEGTDDVPVGTVIALLTDDDEVVSEPLLEEAAAAIAGPAEAAPTPTASQSAVDDRSEPMTGVNAALTRLARASRVTVSPLARRIADAKGIDLGGLVGTGPNGRIVRADLGLNMRPEPSVGAIVAPAPAVALPGTLIAPPPEGVPACAAKLSSMRRTIARRLTESKQTVPHFYLTSRCNLDPLLKLRADLNAGLASRGIKLSVNDLVIKALALALVDVPAANVQFGGDVLHQFERVDVAIAVAIDGGLVTPVIQSVDKASLSAISTKTRALAQKARDGKLQPEDYSGGTVSISNLGMYGIDEMFPVINPPQALILGVGAGIRKPWNVDENIILATIAAFTASFDHRAIDGATAALFMAALKQFIESPITLCT